MSNFRLGDTCHVDLQTVKLCRYSKNERCTAGICRSEICQYCKHSVCEEHLGCRVEYEALACPLCETLLRNSNLRKALNQKKKELDIKRGYWEDLEAEFGAI